MTRNNMKKYRVTVGRLLEYSFTVNAENGDDAADLALNAFGKLTKLPDWDRFDEDVVDFESEYHAPKVLFVNSKVEE